MNKQSQGFTVVEIIIILVLILILGALGFTAFNQFKSHNATSVSQLNSDEEKNQAQVKQFLLDYYADVPAKGESGVDYVARTSHYFTQHGIETVATTIKKCVQNMPMNRIIDNVTGSHGVYNAEVRYIFGGSDAIINETVLKNGDSYKIDGVTCRVE